MTNVQDCPCYIIFNDDKIIIFKRNIPKNILKIEKKKIKDFGLIDVGKWVCWSSKGGKPKLSEDSTWLIKKFLSV